MARVKKKDHEKLSDANIRHVISLLEGEKPVTKKAACEILNISYNTTRLAKIIQEFKDKEEHIAKMKAERRGKPASETEIREIVQDYLDGFNITEISKSMFRSPAFVKNTIERIGVPTKPTTAEDKTSVTFLPDNCVKDRFTVGEIVWSAKYHKPAIVRSEYLDEKYLNKYSCPVYAIYVIEPVDSEGSFFEHVDKGGFNAHAAAYDLGYLGHLKEFGVALGNL